MIRRSILVQVAICATLLAACGDGNDNDDRIPVDVALQVGGIWNGTAVTTLFQPGALGPVLLEDAEIAFFTTELNPDTDTGELRLISDFAVQAKGEISVTEGVDNQADDKLTGSFTAFAPDGYIFSDGAQTAECTIDSGVFIETIDEDFNEIKSIANATYTCIGNVDANAVVATGEFQGDYDADLYEQPSSFNRASGTWSGLDFNTTNNNVVLTLTISMVDGSIIGENDDGCTYSGFIEIIDPAFNLYRITLFVTSCSIVSGTYTGLATLKPGADGEPSEFIYQVDNGSAIITQPLFQFKEFAP